MDKSLDLRRNKHQPVDKGCWSIVRRRFETLFTEHKKTRSDLIIFLSYDKAKISRIVNGQEIPKLQDRVKIAQFFGIDSCVLWENPDIQFDKRGKENEN